MMQVLWYGDIKLLSGTEVSSSLMLMFQTLVTTDYSDIGEKSAAGSTIAATAMFKCWSTLQPQKHLNRSPVAPVSLMLVE